MGTFKKYAEAKSKNGQYVLNTSGPQKATSVSKGRIILQMSVLGKQDKVRQLRPLDSSVLVQK